MANLDPEVQADLELRERTARERPFKTYDQVRWQPPKIVGKVPCRGRCGNVVDWPEEAEEQFAMFNRELARRDEAPLDKTRIVFCDACKAKGTAMQSAARRTQADQLAEVIRELKASETPERETALLAKAKKLGHPDVDGLVQTLRAKLDAKSGKGVKRSRMESL